MLFANVYGIGQMLPVDSPCTYYLDCPGQFRWMGEVNLVKQAVFPNERRAVEVDPALPRR